MKRKVVSCKAGVAYGEKRVAWAKARPRLPTSFVWACDQDVYVGGVTQSIYPGTLSFPIFETLPISQGSLRASEKIS